MNKSRDAGRVGVIVMNGAEKFGDKVVSLLAEKRGMKKSDIKVDVVCPRFSSGEAKGLISCSVRGYDLYIIADMFNYSLTYQMHGVTNHMSPDDHYQDLKRIVGTARGSAKRITVIMPMLYESRQHRCTARESLDCAVCLRELEMYGVDNIVTFDAHDERVKNAVPFMGFDNLSPSKNLISAFKDSEKDIEISKDNLMIISPDEGSISRCIHYASMLGLELGIFYKRRDYTRVINGANPIIAHEFLGEDLKGKSVIIIDDIISSGSSIIDIMEQLKAKGANKIYVFATFGMFTNGLDRLKEVHDEGKFEKIFITNLTYLSDEYAKEDFIVQVDMSEVLSGVIDVLNTEGSMGVMLEDSLKLKQ